MNFSRLFVLIGSFSLLTVAASSRAGDPSRILQIFRQVVSFSSGDQHVDIVLVDAINALVLDDGVTLDGGGVAQANRNSVTGKLSIRVGKNTLPTIDGDEAEFVACHELGHLMGDHSFAELNYQGEVYAVEGEADYFAGKCMVQYGMEMEGLDERGAELKAMEIAQRTFTERTGSEKSGRNAETDRFPGINLTYPHPDCRVLSVWRGAQGLPRPACWFNPNNVQVSGRL